MSKNERKDTKRLYIQVNSGTKYAKKMQIVRKALCNDENGGKLMLCFHAVTSFVTIEVTVATRTPLGHETRLNENKRSEIHSNTPWD